MFQKFLYINSIVNEAIKTNSNFFKKNFCNNKHKTGKIN